MPPKIAKNKTASVTPRRGETGASKLTTVTRPVKEWDIGQIKPNTTVFLSYAKSYENGPATDRIRELAYYLRTKPFKAVWVDDPGEEGTTDGPEHSAQVISSADIFVACLSNAYAQSRSCMRELKLASDKHKLMVAFSVEDSDDYVIPKPIEVRLNADKGVPIADRILGRQVAANPQFIYEALCRQLSEQVSKTKPKNDKTAPQKPAKTKKVALRPAGTDGLLNTATVPYFTVSYWQRPEIAAEIMLMIRKIAQRKDGGVAILYGETGVGKSSLVADLFESEDTRRQLVEELRFSTVIWLNCAQWSATQPFDKTCQLTFSDMLAEAANIEVQGRNDQPEQEFKSLASMLAQFELPTTLKGQKRRILYVLDDIYNAGLVSFLRTQLPSAIILGITRDPSAFVTSKNLARQLKIASIYKLKEMTLKGLCAMLSLITHTPASNLTNLADQCYNLPLLADLIGTHGDRIASILQLKIDGRIEPQKTMTMGTTVRELFSYSLTRFLDEDGLNQYYAFLFFEPDEPINPSEIAVLWGVGNQQAERLAITLTRKGLVRRVQATPHQDGIEQQASKLKKGFLIVHRPLWETLLHHAMNWRSSESTRKSPSAIALIRVGLIRIDDEKPDDFDPMAVIVKPFLVKCLRGHQWQLLDKCLESIPCDLLDVVRDAFDANPSGIGKIFQKQTPLSWAASRGHIEPLRYMVQKYASAVQIVNSLGQSPLNQAAKNGHLDCCRLLLSKWPKSAQIPDKFGLIPLAVASKEGQLDVVRFLEQRYPDALQHIDKDGKTALILACEHGHLETVRYLIEKWPEAMHVRDKADLNAAFHAVKANHFDVVRFLVQRDPECVQQADSKLFRTPISWAAENGNLEMVMFLTNIWFDGLKIQSKEGLTPLGYAASRNNLETVRFLAKKWTDALTTLDKFKRTPMALAVSSPNANLEMVKYLGDMWPDSIRLVDNRGETPIAKAAAHGRLAIVKYLAEKCPESVRQLDAKARSPLTRAARNGQLGTCKFLVKKWSDAIKIPDRDGRTPLSYAAEHGKTAIVRFFCEKHADQVVESHKVGQQDSSHGRYPLLWAAANGHLDAVKCMAEKLDRESGLVARLADGDGKTALSWACYNGHSQVAKYLAWLCGPEAIERPDNKGTTPLAWAIKRSYRDVAEMLRRFL